MRSRAREARPAAALRPGLPAPPRLLGGPMCLSSHAWPRPASKSNFLLPRRVFWLLPGPAKCPMLSPMNITMDITIEHEPRPEDVRVLEERIYEFNVACTGLADGKLLAAFMRDADGATIGGLFGWTWGATCYIRYLFIPAALRNQGYGSRLMAAAEREAIARGCIQIALETHDFQAPDFYRRLGFEVVGRIEGYPSGHQQLTMMKRLSA